MGYRINLVSLHVPMKCVLLNHAKGYSLILQSYLIPVVLFHLGRMK
ncbi:unnamed protein product [Schistosoma mattheei]|uniref:Uncharacterized protein n=1 Tax=Schistosoma mattheei TaxID=31246 RepID=A0A183Q8R1_9TREM|nr:unnamed protein product [Schistosoma mattheei]